MNTGTDGDGQAGGIADWVVVFLKGVAMGTADAIPGVSGGTIALITGIYDRLVEAIAGVSEHAPDLVDDLVGGGNPGRFSAAARTLRMMDVPFLVVLGLGVVSGVVTLANIVDYALHNFRAVTFAFFFGVILASPVVLRQEVRLREPRPLAAGVIGALIAFAVSGLPRQQAEYALPALFLIGAVAISAMVLPGISGSLVLLIIGAYDTMTRAVSELTNALAGGARAGADRLDAAIEPLVTLAVFAAGAMVGLLTFARVVSWAIDTNRVVTMTFLVGVMFGALRTPYLEITSNVAAFTPHVLLELVGSAIVGVLVVLALAYVSEDIA